MMWFTGNRLTLLKNVFAYRTGWRQVSKKLPAYLSVPDLVVNLIWMAPWPDASAPGVAVETVTSSIASTFGEMSDQNPSPDLASGLCVWIPSMVTRTAEIGSPADRRRVPLDMVLPGVHARQQRDEVQRVPGVERQVPDLIRIQRRGDGRRLRLDDARSCVDGHRLGDRSGLERDFQIRRCRRDDPHVVHDGRLESWEREGDGVRPGSSAATAKSPARLVTTGGEADAGGVVPDDHGDAGAARRPV